MARASEADNLTSGKTLEYCARAFSSVGWFVPAYLSIGFLVRLARQLENLPPQEKQESLGRLLALAYSPAQLAAMLIHRYSVCPVVSEFKEAIGDAIAAFFLGLSHAAVVTLLPPVEGVIQGVETLHAIANGGAAKLKLLRIIDAVIDRERARNLAAIDERLLMLTSLRAFLETHLYEWTTSYRGPGKLNRHGILHGVFADGDYASAYNFYRLVSVLDQMCFLITIEKGGLSMLAPDPTVASTKLAGFYETLAAIAALGHSLRTST